MFSITFVLWSIRDVCVAIISPSTEQQKLSQLIMDHLNNGISSMAYNMCARDNFSATLYIYIIAIERKKSRLNQNAKQKENGMNTKQRANVC